MMQLDGEKDAQGLLSNLLWAGYFKVALGFILIRIPNDSEAESRRH